MKGIIIALAAALLACCADSSKHEVRSAVGAELRKRKAAGMLHRGVNHAHVHRRGNGYGSAMSAAQLDWLKSIGVNAIALTPFGYQEGAASDRIVGFESDSILTLDESMTDADLAAEIDSAHARGIRVTLKPHIWSNDFWDGSAWHGSVDQRSPEEHRRWWESYRRLALYYARFAEAHDVETYCIGTELVKMTTGYPDEWRALIADVRKIYSGELTYAAHWYEEYLQIPFWSDLDYIGVNAYFPLDLPDTATVHQLTHAWEPYRRRIDSLSRAFDRRVLFLEAGYRPVAGTWREPWTYEGGTPDTAAQGRAYEALLTAFRDSPALAGVYWWKTFTDHARAERYGEQTGFSFKERSGEAVLRRVWQ